MAISMLPNSIDLIDMLVPGTLAGDRMVGYDDSPNGSPS